MRRFFDRVIWLAFAAGVIGTISVHTPTSKPNQTVRAVDTCVGHIDGCPVCQRDDGLAPLPEEIRGDNTWVVEPPERDVNR